MSKCYFCGSADSMAPFRRAEHVFILSRILRSLRWRYCRACTRHYLTFHAEPPAARPDGLIVPEPRSRRKNRVA